LENVGIREGNRVNSKNYAIAAVAVCVVALGTVYATFATSNEPSHSDLKRIVSDYVYVYRGYELKDLTIISSEVETIRGRDFHNKFFEATLNATEDQFIHVETVGDYIFMDYAVRPGHEATVAGDLSVYFADGEWQGDLFFRGARDLRNGDSEEEIRRNHGSGRTTVIIGTPAEEEARQALAEKNNISLESLVGEWNGRSECRHGMSMDYVMTLNDQGELGVLDGHVRFASSEDSGARNPSSGSFSVKAEVIEIVPVGLFTVGGYPLVIRHNAWIERPSDMMSTRFHLEVEGDDLAGRLSMGGDQSGVSCNVRFQKS